MNNNGHGILLSFVIISKIQPPRFCNRLSDDDDDDIEATTEGAHNRLEAVHRFEAL